MVRTPTKQEDCPQSSASAGMNPSSFSSQLRQYPLSFRSMWADSGFLPITKIMESPAAAISGTARQQSKSYVLVSFTYDKSSPDDEFISEIIWLKYLPEGFGQKVEATTIHLLAHLCGRDWRILLVRIIRQRRWIRNLRKRSLFAKLPAENFKSEK